MSQVACRNFKMSCVGVLSRLHNAVGNLATYIWLRQSFVAISFERCRYFLAHVACRNLPWQGLLSSSKFVIGRFLLVLVLHVGLFVFAFFSTSRVFQGHRNLYPNMSTYWLYSWRTFKVVVSRQLVVKPV